jgi:hypothetical protein
VARLERAFRSATAYVCQPAEAGRFWALYGLLNARHTLGARGCAASYNARFVKPKWPQPAVSAPS